MMNLRDETEFEFGLLGQRQKNLYDTATKKVKSLKSERLQEVKAQLHTVQESIKTQVERRDELS